MFYQAYQKVGYRTAACTRIRTRPRVVQQGRTRYQRILPLARTNSPKCRVRVGKSYYAKCRVRVWMPYRTYERVGYGYGCCTKLVKGSGTGIDVIPSLSKDRVRVWMVYQAYQRVEYGTAACIRTRTRPQVFEQGRTRYQTYQNVGYGWGSRTKLTKVSGTGMDAVSNLPKGRVRVWMLHQAYQTVGSRI